MTLMPKFLRQLLRRVDANSAVEYGILLAGVATIIIAIVFSVGTTVRAGFRDVCDSLNSRMGAGLGCSDGTTPAPTTPAVTPPPTTPPHDD